jgi:magnesium chelatase family protein
MLIGAMNPCPCGYAGDTVRTCKCTPQQIDRYSARLSGPLRDRLDLTVPVAAMPAKDLSDAAGGESSAAIRERVVAARERQRVRNGILNATLHGRRLRSVTQLDAEARRMLDRALERLALSARGHDRVLRVARTIADLGGSDQITSEHLGEALQFRGQD